MRHQPGYTVPAPYALVKLLRLATVVFICSYYVIVARPTTAIFGAYRIFVT